METKFQYPEIELLPFGYLKFKFSKKATKIDEIFTVDLLHSVKSTVKISSIFVAFLENMNFKMPL